jgi:hypothetical protein
LRSLLGVEWREMWTELNRACGQCKIACSKSEKSALRWQFLANCTTSTPSTLLVGLSSLWIFVFPIWASQKTPLNQGQKFESGNDILSDVCKIWDEISCDTLEAVFRD